MTHIPPGNSQNPVASALIQQAAHRQSPLANARVLNGSRILRNVEVLQAGRSQISRTLSQVCGRLGNENAELADVLAGFNLGTREGVWKIINMSDSERNELVALLQIDFDHPMEAVERTVARALILNAWATEGPVRALILNTELSSRTPLEIIVHLINMQAQMASEADVNLLQPVPAFVPQVNVQTFENGRFSNPDAWRHFSIYGNGTAECPFLFSQEAESSDELPLVRNFLNSIPDPPAMEVSRGSIDNPHVRSLLSHGTLGLSCPINSDDQHIVVFWKTANQVQHASLLVFSEVREIERCLKSSLVSADPGMRIDSVSLMFDETALPDNLSGLQTADEMRFQRRQPGLFRYYQMQKVATNIVQAFATSAGAQFNLYPICSAHNRITVDVRHHGVIVSMKVNPNLPEMGVDQHGRLRPIGELNPDMDPGT